MDIAALAYVDIQVGTDLSMSKTADEISMMLSPSLMMSSKV